MGIPHLALNLRLGRQGRHRVHDHHIHGTGAHQHVADLKCLFSSVRLRDQKLVDVHAQLFGIHRVKGMFRVHKGTGLASTLGFRDHLEGQRGLAGRFRPEDLDHPPQGQTTNAQGHIQPQRPRRHCRHRLPWLVAHFHDRALAELAFNLGERGVQCLLAVVIHCICLLVGWCLPLSRRVQRR